MKLRNLFYLAITLCCLLGFNSTGIGQSIVKKLDLKPTEAKLEMQGKRALSYQVEIAGPYNYYWQQSLEDVQNITITRFNHLGEAFEDGIYTLQITPIFSLTEEQKEALSVLRQNNDERGMIAFRRAHNLPNQLDVYSVNYSILNGSFVIHQAETTTESGAELPDGYNIIPPASHDIQNTSTNNHPPQTMDNSPLPMRAQVFTQDVIVQSSLCVGFDCSSSESFGSDTERLKENNLRIHFDDTSNSASFPKNDWRITANDETNGGSDYFAIQDATAGTTPFRVEAGAGNNALHVDASGGNIGMGTSTPVVELHIADGDSPTMRLEQNGSSGFTPQTWDVAGNETNFFVRDVTNGSRLPFKIRPSAPTNSLYINTNGDIGLSTDSPQRDLHINSTEPSIRLQNNSTSQDWDIVSPNADSCLYFNDVKHSKVPFTIESDASDHSLYVTNDGDVGIGINTPGNKLHVNGHLTVGGDIIVASDRRFKKDVQNMQAALPLIKALKPKQYAYRSDEFANTYLPKGIQYGFIAQDVEQILPEMVNLHSFEKNKEGQTLFYKGLDYSNFVPFIVKAMQEQHSIISEQKTEIAQLKKDLKELQEQLKVVTDFIKKQN